jgi:hypothetical protein
VSEAVAADLRPDPATTMTTTTTTPTTTRPALGLVAWS